MLQPPTGTGNPDADVSKDTQLKWEFNEDNDSLYVTYPKD